MNHVGCREKLHTKPTFWAQRCVDMMNTKAEGTNREHVKFWNTAKPPGNWKPAFLSSSGVPFLCSTPPLALLAPPIACSWDGRTLFRTYGSRACEPTLSSCAGSLTLLSFRVDVTLWCFTCFRFRGLAAFQNSMCSLFVSSTFVFIMFIHLFHNYIKWHMTISSFRFDVTF